MAPKTRTETANAGAKDPTPKQTIKSKLYINARENNSKNSRRCRHCGASVRSEDTETASLQDTANTVANVPAAPLDSIEPVQPRESAQVPSPPVPAEWNGRRRKTTFSRRYFYQYTYKRRGGLPTRDELEIAHFLVTEDFRSKWVLGSAAATMVQMKKNPNYSAPMLK